MFFLEAQVFSIIFLQEFACLQCDQLPLISSLITGSSKDDQTMAETWFLTPLTIHFAQFKGDDEDDLTHVQLQIRNAQGGHRDTAWAPVLVGGPVFSRGKRFFRFSVGTEVLNMVVWVMFGF